MASAADVRPPIRRPLAHINYAARYWPASQGGYHNADFEGEYRAALRALAQSSRAMEINTSGYLPLGASLLTWWREEGGPAVSFGSDAHDPFTIGHQFASAAALAQGAGFGPGQRGRGLWVRRWPAGQVPARAGTGPAVLPDAKPRRECRGIPPHLPAQNR